MKKKIKIFLFLIVAFAFFLRFWQIGQFPVGLNADEASYGYNAYSLILTGKDEHGQSWPIHLKSFADYKPAGTAYILIPFVKLFGLNVGAIRLPSVLAGTFSVLLIFLLVQELFSSSSLSLLAAFFLAISPWHIHFSRGAWETNLATTFMLLGVWLFYKGLKKPKFFVGSILAFVFSMYTYHTPRVVVPLLGIFLVVFYRRQVFKYLKWTVFLSLVGIILLAPLLLSFLGPAGSARFSGLSMFSEVGPVWQVNRLRGEHPDLASVPAVVFHNKPLVYSGKFLENYLSHFNGSFLFVNGDRVERSNPPEMGEMYFLDLLFLIAGFYFLLFRKPKNWQLPLVWLLLAPIPAALTFQVPSVLRAHNMIIPLTVISSYGFYNLIIFVKKKLSRKLFFTFCLLLALLISWNLAYYLHQYFVHYPKIYHEAWEDGLKGLVDYLWPIKSNYSRIYVTEQYDQPYIIFLFYTKYPPDKFQEDVVLTPRDKLRFSTVRELENFYFKFIDWESLEGQENILVCGTDEEIPENRNVIKAIKFNNGEIAFQCAQL